MLSSGSALHHKLAHVLGGYGLPHAETHAILLPHTTRFNLSAAAPARARLAEAFRASDPADALAAMIAAFPIPQRLRDVGLEQSRIADAAAARTGGAPKHISAAAAEQSYKIVGNEFSGWFQFQPLYARIVKEQPDLLE